MSTLSVANLSDGTDTVGTEYVVNGSAKAWATWDATSTGFIDSLNASSLTDNATGDFDVNFTNSFSAGGYGTAGNQAFSSNITTTTYMVQPRNSGTVLAGSLGVYLKYVGPSASGLGDYQYNAIHAFGDLA